MEREQLAPLSSKQIRLLKKTFRLLDTDAVTKRFYTTLFLRHPEIRPLFPGDLTELSTKLISVFELVIFSFREGRLNEYILQREVSVGLSSLGKKHAEKGVADKYYPLANEILLQSMREEAGFLFPPEAEAAWRLALSHLSAAMLSSPPTHEKEVQTSSLRESFQYIRSLFSKS